MKTLRDHDLIDVYKTARELQLDPEFIDLLYQEMKRRKLIDFKYSKNNGDQDGWSKLKETRSSFDYLMTS